MNTFRYRTGNPWVGIVILILLLIFSFWLFNKIWYLLGLVAPVLLIVTLFVDYKVITGFVRSLWDQLRRDPITGLLKVGLTVIFHPFVMAYLFFKAVTGRSVRKARQQYEDRRRGILTDYEEIESRQMEEPMDFPESKMRHQPRPKEDKKPPNPYESLFK